MKRIVIIIAAVVAMASCNSNSCDSSCKHGEEGHVHGPGCSHGHAEENSGPYYGDSIDITSPLSVQTAIAGVVGQDSVKTKFTGKVTDVCKSSGCWMEVESEDGTPLTIWFKGSDFVVPTDIEGKEVVVDGYAFHEVFSVEELKSIAEAEGSSVSEIADIQEGTEEFTFVADGVFIK